MITLFVRYPVKTCIVTGILIFGVFAVLHLRRPLVGGQKL
jgi:hypothetical protein